MNEKSSYTIDVQVETRFVPDQSKPGDNRYVFAYSITLRNAGTVAARLLGRHWMITDANGKMQEVRGDGVVGEQPDARRRWHRVRGSDSDLHPVHPPYIALMASH
jgi:ApaG protein